ncbi:hypothetical protein [Caballeronia sp. AZ10_KS36]|uniref:hypothetical protein n=1 Tax=Caballeronia sp. AZ10_KS36 TaxID=2921757 RepID=UPI002029194E|nr:hypothetical protein [Caballeronia sp. AZ10_KS36]
MLKYNPETKVIFDNTEPAIEPIREITRDEIPDLIANGAGVDPSANVGEQTSSPAVTDGVAPAAQAPAVPVTGLGTGVDAGNADAAVTGSPSVTAAPDANSASSVDTQPAIDSNSIGASTASTVDVAKEAGNETATPAISDSQSVDASPEVISNAQADAGGAGASDLNPTPAAPNTDAQAAPTGVSADTVPVAAAEEADGGAGSAVNPIPTAPAVSPELSASAEEDEHPLAIIAEVEALVLLIGNAALHQYHRLIKRLADLKNHPQVKGDAE